VNGATETRDPPVSRAALWFAFLGGPVAWTARLLASYPLVSVACRMGSPAILNAITAVTAAVGIAAAVTGWLAYRRVRDAAHAGLGDPNARARFMALGGVLISIIFTFAILNEGMSVLLQDPCLRAL
jgi:uncharacterized membrane protein YidH (DUF202 family)